MTAQDLLASDPLTAEQFLSSLRERGVQISVDGDRLRLNAPKGVLTADLRGEIAARRDEVIRLLRESESRMAPRAPSIPHVPRDQPVPASPGQERLWFLDQLDPGDPAYNIVDTRRVTGPVDARIVERALNALVQRHEVLRTTFRGIDGRPLQIVAPDLELAVPVVDLRALAPAEREAEAQRLTVEEAQQPFDLANGPLLRYRLFQLGEQDWMGALTIHHIVFDDWSLGVFRRDLTDLYFAIAAGQASPLADLPFQYADYAAWQRQQLKTPALQAQLAYWRERLQGAPPVLELPTDRPRPAIRTTKGAFEFRLLPPALVESLEALGRRHRATPFMVFFAAFATLLHRYTSQDDLLIGSPIAGRTRADTEQLIGLFVNMLVLRTDFAGDPTFADLLERVREVALGAYANQDLPFEKLVEALQPERNLSHTPLFQVMFNMLNSATELKPWDVDNGTAKFDLTLTLVPTVDGLQCIWEYSTDLFDRATIARMARHYETLLDGIVADPGRRVAELPLLDENERRQILFDWNATAADYPRDRSIHDLFEEQAARSPNAVAVIFENQHLTYADLKARADRLAGRLRRTGLRAGTPVGVFLERSLEVPESLLAVLKAGGAYVPLDPGYPPDRLAFMLTDARVPVLLTQQRLLDRLPPHDAVVICVDAEEDRPGNDCGPNQENAGEASDLVYVIYTSGSTGRPKGVLGLHRGAVNRFHWMWQAYPFAPDDVCCQKTSLSFVDSVWELFGPLLRGVPLVIVPDEAVHDPHLLVRCLAEHHVTRIVLVPSLLQALLDTFPDLGARLPDLRFWVTSGEAIAADLVDRFFAAVPQATLVNLYGSSEVSADATFYEVSRDSQRQSVPIGRPIANTSVYLLDRSMQPVPVGVPGELYVGGDGLARGYLNRPELTAERFIPHPFRSEPGARLYRTGDIGRYQQDGTIEYLGRTDHQVKIRGMRVELEEIEAALRKQPGVADAVVDLRRYGNGEQRLVGYVAAEPERSLAAADLRAALQEQLPDHMVPSAIVVLPALPLTPNGKVDRLALPDVGETADGERERTEPATDTEKRLVQIWEELLPVRPIGTRDNFFDVGGHSLLSVRLFARIESEFGTRLPIATIYQGGTIRHLARALDRPQSETVWRALVPLQPNGTRPPFFCMHAIDGDVFWYTALARHIGEDQPFYGIRARGMDGVQEPHGSVEEAAASYIEEIKTVQPSGPYYLGGFSTGGTMAFEVAQQLRARGEDVALVALLDHPPGNSDYYRVRWGPSFALKWLRAAPARLKQFWDRDRAAKIAIVQHKWTSLLVLMHLRERPVYQDDPESFAMAIGAHLLGDVSLLSDHHKRVIAALRRGMLAYRPRAYAGRLTLFRARIQPLFCSHDPNMGWGSLAAGGLDIYPVEGHHLSIVQEPDVVHLARALCICLERAQAAAAAHPPG